MERRRKRKNRRRGHYRGRGERRGIERCGVGSTEWTDVAVKCMCY